MKLNSQYFSVKRKDLSRSDKRLAPLICRSFQQSWLRMNETDKFTLVELKFIHSAAPSEVLFGAPSHAYKVHAIIAIPWGHSTTGIRSGLRAKGWATSISGPDIAIDKYMTQEALESWWFTKAIPIRDEVYAQLGLPDDVWDNAQAALCTL